MSSSHHHGHHHMPPAGAVTEIETAGAERAVRIELEARPVTWHPAPGVSIDGYEYNGQVPGPLLELRQGEPVEIRFTNRLSEPTLIHWHGLRVPAAMDGTQSTQRPVAPGETFT